jgi:ABC-type nickel/cobalt efflux system permease component RcnA
MNTSLVLTIIMTVAMAVWMAPGIFAANRGRVLRNIALWLAVFTGLMLIYKNFGPDSAHPLFHDTMHGAAVEKPSDAPAPSSNAIP